MSRGTLTLPTDHFDRDAEHEQLVALARSAVTDARAMSELVRRTSPVVWRACAALVDRASADDLTQETFLRAMRSLGSYRGESSPVRWLITIARRVCSEEIARRQRSRGLHTRLRGEARDLARDPSALVDLTDAVDRLHPDRREAFLLTAVAGMSYAEAAEVCGCPIGTIRSRVARARDDLIGWLADHDIDGYESAVRALSAVG